jgi:hypothetical protein
VDCQYAVGGAGARNTVLSVTNKITSFPALLTG